jgi:hypothetical protein
MVDDTARDRAIYHALKAADEVAAALQARLIEEHRADPYRTAAHNPVMQGAVFEVARDRAAAEHGLCDAAGHWLERHGSSVDGPAALPVSGIWRYWPCHLAFLPMALPASGWCGRCAASSGFRSR